MASREGRGELKCFGVARAAAPVAWAEKSASDWNLPRRLWMVFVPCCSN